VAEDKDELGTNGALQTSQPFRPQHGRHFHVTFAKKQVGVDKSHQIEQKATIIYAVNMQVSVCMIDSKLKVTTIIGLLLVLTLEENLILSKIQRTSIHYMI
jgi:hypothetical protein